MVHLPTYLRGIDIGSAVKNISFFLLLTVCNIYRVALLTLGITQRVIIDSHVDTHWLTATLGCSHQAAFLLTTVCRTQ